VDVCHPRWCRNAGRTGGSAGVDDAYGQHWEPGIGAEIMGANKCGPPGWRALEAAHHNVRDYMIQ
jgi:hypothetical protein